MLRQFRRLLVLVLLVSILAIAVSSLLGNSIAWPDRSPTRASPTVLDDIPDADGGQGQRFECPPPPIRLPDPLFREPAAGTSLNNPSVDYIPICRPPTPLFIAFGFNQSLLRQTILSFLADGWPASQIVVFDNSGISAINDKGSALSDHPSSLDYTFLLVEYKVAIFRLRIRHSFAQLQNVWIDLAKESNITDFYWAHQDIVVRGYDRPGRFFYHQILREQTLLASKDPRKWAFGFHRYDLLSHVNVRVADQIGNWDDRIPYYPTDCDYYSRARHIGLVIFDYQAGDIYDVASCLSNISSLLLSPGTHEYALVTRELEELEAAKLYNKDGRNVWQGFGKAYDNLIIASRQNYRLKWRTSDCDPRRVEN